jgi:murein DD-endopeptidase MepM/ murein hydrolase activator NlpD
VGTLLLALGITLAWPFDDSEWYVLPASSQSSHRGDEAHAQDWLPGRGAASGRIVRAAIKGVVVQSEWSCSSFGRTIVIWNQRASVGVRFAHLQAIQVSVGDSVDLGDVVGTVGASGPAPWCQTGSLGPPRVAHLHIAAYRNVTVPVGRPVHSVSLGSDPTFAVPFVLASPEGGASGNAQSPVLIGPENLKRRKN